MKRLPKNLPENPQVSPKRCDIGMVAMGRAEIIMAMIRKNISAPFENSVFLSLTQQRTQKLCVGQGWGCRLGGSI